MQKRLMRSQTDKMLGGVCGGLADYFLIDPVIVRLIFVLITITTGLGILFYPVLWLIMPKAPIGIGPDSLASSAQGWQQQSASGVQQEADAVQYAEQRSSMYVGAHSRPGTYGTSEDMPPSTGETSNLGGMNMPGFGDEHQLSAPPRSRIRRGAGWGGFVLIGLGLMMLSEYFSISTEFVMPLIFMIVGALLVFRRR